MDPHLGPLSKNSKWYEEPGVVRILVCGAKRWYETWYEEPEVVRKTVRGAKRWYQMWYQESKGGAQVVRGALGGEWW